MPAQTHSIQRFSLLAGGFTLLWVWMLDLLLDLFFICFGWSARKIMWFRKTINRYRLSFNWERTWRNMWWAERKLNEYVTRCFRPSEKAAGSADEIKKTKIERAPKPTMSENREYTQVYTNHSCRRVCFAKVKSVREYVVYLSMWPFQQTSCRRTHSPHTILPIPDSSQMARRCGETRACQSVFVSFHCDVTPDDVCVCGAQTCWDAVSCVHVFMYNPLPPLYLLVHGLHQKPLSFQTLFSRHMPLVTTSSVHILNAHLLLDEPLLHHMEVFGAALQWDKHSANCLHVFVCDCDFLGSHIGGMYYILTVALSAYA